MIVKNDEKGIVLVSTLVLMVLGLGLVVTLLKLTTHATKLTGLEQQYTSAIEASKGGVELMISMIRSGLYAPPAIASASVGPSGSACLEQKMTTECTTAPCWASCGANATTSDPTVEPDITMSLSGYNMFLKITDTKKTLDTTDPDPMNHIPMFLYSVQVRSISSTTNDQAEISFLYQIDE